MLMLSSGVFLVMNIYILSGISTCFLVVWSFTKTNCYQRHAQHNQGGEIGIMVLNYCALKCWDRDNKCLVFCWVFFEGTCLLPYSNRCAGSVSQVHTIGIPNCFKNG